MNKTELVKAIAAKTNLKLSDTEKGVNAFIETLSEELKKKGRVTLVGFGTFTVGQRRVAFRSNIGTGPREKNEKKA